MSQLADGFVNALLAHIFQNSAMAGLGDAGGVLGSVSAGSLFLSLHTADPGDTGNQSTSEASYGGYARIAASRSGGGWSVGSRLAQNAGVLAWPTATSGTATCTHVGLGYAGSGSGTLIARFPIGDVTGPVAFTANGSTDVLSAYGLTLANDDTIVFYAGPQTSLPTNITEGQTYYVRDLSGSTFKIASTLGGVALDITDGGGIVQKLSAIQVIANVAPQLAANQLVLRM